MAIAVFVSDFKADDATRDAVNSKIARAAWDEAVKTRYLVAAGHKSGQPGTLWDIVGGFLELSGRRELPGTRCLGREWFRTPLLSLPSAVATVSSS
jgi:hypothetical protein